MMSNFSQYSVFELASFLSVNEFRVWEQPKVIQDRMKIIADEIFFLLELKDQENWYRKFEVEKRDGKKRETFSPTGLSVMKDITDKKSCQNVSTHVLIPSAEGIGIKRNKSIVLDINGEPIDRDVCPEVYSPLEYFQGQVSRILESYLQMPRNICAFRKNFNCYKAMRGMLNKLHVEGTTITDLFKTDISNYFPSISDEMIVEALISHNNLNLKSLGKVGLLQEEAARLLAYLCTYDGHLTQGSPSSPVLANLVGFERMDKNLFQLLNRKGIEFIRYADDIIVLSVNGISDNEQKAILDIIHGAGFTAAEQKTRHITRESKDTHYKGLGVSIKSDSIDNTHFGFKVPGLTDKKHYEAGITIINNGYEEEVTGQFAGYVGYNNLVGQYGKIAKTSYISSLDLGDYVSLSRKLQHLLLKDEKLRDHVIKTKVNVD